MSKRSFLMSVDAGSVSVMEVNPDDPRQPVAKPPVVSSGETLAGMYFSGEDASAAVARVQPLYVTYIDTPDGGTQAAGSGDQLPPIHYGSQDKAIYPNPMVELLNPEHPYFQAAAAAGAPVTAQHIAAQLKAAPLVLETHAAIAAGIDPTKVWETAQNTSSPADMSLLFMLEKGGRTGWDLALQYRRWYYTTYPSGQAPTGGHNSEGLTPGQIQAVIDGTEAPKPYPG